MEPDDSLEAPALGAGFAEAWSHVRIKWQSATSVGSGSEMALLEEFIGRFPECEAALADALLDPSIYVAAFSLAGLEKMRSPVLNNPPERMLTSSEPLMYGSGCLMNGTLKQFTSDLLCPKVGKEDIERYIASLEEYRLLWNGKDRVCPKCSKKFRSVQDLGVCPECRFSFYAGRTQGDAAPTALVRRQEAIEQADRAWSGQDRSCPKCRTVFRS